MGCGPGRHPCPAEVLSNIMQREATSRSVSRMHKSMLKYMPTKSQKVLLRKVQDLVVGRFQLHGMCRQSGSYSVVGINIHALKAHLIKHTTSQKKHMQVICIARVLSWSWCFMCCKRMGSIFDSANAAVSFGSNHLQASIALVGLGLGVKTV